MTNEDKKEMQLLLAEFARTTMKQEMRDTLDGYTKTTLKQEIAGALDVFAKTTMKQEIAGSLDVFAKTTMKQEMMVLLGEFTDTVLLPAVDQLMDDKLEEKLEEKLNKKFDEKLGGFHYEMKSYIDRKLTSHHADIISAIRGDKVRDHNYKTQVVGVLRRNDLVNEDESFALTQLAN